MAYTPPAGDAAHFTWLDAAAYTAPAGDAAHLAFAPDVPQATMLGVGLLGAVPYPHPTPPSVHPV